MTRRLLVLFSAFILLGLPEGVLGTAWPSMRVTYDRPESSLAQLLVAYTIGYLVCTASMGRLVERFGGDTTTRIGVAVTAVGFLGYATSPVWVAALAAATIVGGGGGIVDASINAEVALHHGQRTMNLLHAAFGVGATLGPLFMTALLATAIGWRVAFVALLCAELLIFVALGSAARSGVTTEHRDGSTNTRYAPLVRRPQLVLGVSLVYFAIYVAAEVSIGQWSYTMLTEARGVSETTAGLAVAAYWGGLTAGRLILGALGDRLHPMRLLRSTTAIALIAIIWFFADWPGALFALPILGMSFAGTFPALVLMTSSWLPTDVVTRAVGFQLAASSGGAIIAAIVFGFIADRSGLEATVTAMLVLVACLGVVQFAIEQVARSTADGRPAVSE